MSEQNDNERDQSRPLKNQAKTIVKMSKEADRVKRHIGAEACIVICVFKDGNQLRVQDAGMFPMLPVDFYHIMQQAHQNGQLGHNSPKLKPTSRIIKPH
jgi:hypothetical protein